MPAARYPKGFTLVEILVATALGAMVMALAFQMYFGANKAKSYMGASVMLNDAGQKALNDIYTSLHANKHLFQRGTTGTTFLDRLNLAGFDASPGAPSPGVTADELLLPQIDATGAVWKRDATGTANVDFNAADVGNGIFFAESLPDVLLGDENNVLQQAFGSSNYRIGAYQLHLYYLARYAYVPGRFAEIKPGADYTYHLMSWTSVPYVDYSDLTEMMNNLDAKALLGTVATSTVHTFITDKLSSLQDAGKTPHFSDAMDLSVSDAGLSATPAALHLLTTSDYRTLNDDHSHLFTCATMRAATLFDMSSGFGIPTVAFNTADVPLPDHESVPTYAEDTAVPYGFETMVVGPADARQVLLHLALAARTVPGKKQLTATALQQIVQVYDQ